MNREQQQQGASISQQADELRARLRAQEAEIDALMELWSTVLPTAWMPGNVQFVVWLRCYGFALAEKGITIAGRKLHQITREANRKWTADDAIRYASGVMARSQEQQQGREESMEDKREFSGAYTERLLKADPDSAARGPRNSNVQTTTVRKV